MKACIVCGQPRRGSFKDTPVCKQACGHVLALRLVASVPGVLALLPEHWRAAPVDVEPEAAAQKALEFEDPRLFGGSVRP